MFDRPGVHRDYKTLLAVAESGDANADYELSVKLAGCKAVPLELSDIERTLQKLRPINAYKTQARAFKRDVPPAALSPTAIAKWRERAAAWGSVAARIETIRIAARRARDDAHWTREKMDDKTSEYIRSVEGAALKGNLDALDLMSALYPYGLLVPTEVVRSYAYSAAAHFSDHSAAIGLEACDGLPQPRLDLRQVDGHERGQSVDRGLVHLQLHLLGKIVRDAVNGLARPPVREQQLKMARGPHDPRGYPNALQLCQVNQTLGFVIDP